MKITISETLQTKLPDFKVGVVQFKTTVNKGENLVELISTVEKEVENTYQLSDVLEIENIKASREGYKALGKDPSRYRLAVESLHRRLVKGNTLYRINDAVDLGNILSIKTKRSVAVLDQDQIKGDILIRIGRDEPYEGIGRGQLNVENIPVYCDEIGPFGSPTSDTLRTAITNDTKNILLFIISFNGNTNLEEDIKLCIDLYQTYTNSHDFSSFVL